MKVLKFIGSVLLDLLKGFGSVFILIFISLFIYRGLEIFVNLPGFFSFAFGCFIILSMFIVSFILYFVFDILKEYFKTKWENIK